MGELTKVKPGRGERPSLCIAPPPAFPPPSPPPAAVSLREGAPAVVPPAHAGWARRNGQHHSGSGRPQRQQQWTVKVAGVGKGGARASHLPTQCRTSRPQMGRASSSSPLPPSSSYCMPPPPSLTNAPHSAVTRARAHGAPSPAQPEPAAVAAAHAAATRRQCRLCRCPFCCRRRRRALVRRENGQMATHAEEGRSGLTVAPDRLRPPPWGWWIPRRRGASPSREGGDRGAGRNAACSDGRRAGREQR